MINRLLVSSAMSVILYQDNGSASCHLERTRKVTTTGVEAILNTHRRACLSVASDRIQEYRFV